MSNIFKKKGIKNSHSGGVKVTYVKYIQEKRDKKLTCGGR